MKESLKIGLFNNEIFNLLILKILRDTPLILSLSVIIGLGLLMDRLKSSSELIILNLSGFGKNHFIKLILYPVIFFLTLSIVFTGFVSPSINSQIDLIKDSAAKRPVKINFNDKEFIEFNSHKIVFYAENLDSSEDNKQNFSNIFLFKNSDVNKDNSVFISAKSAEKNISSNNFILFLRNGRLLEFSNTSLKKISNFDFMEIKIPFKFKNQLTEGTDIDNLNFIELISNISIINLKEIIYRLSQTIMLIILTFFTISIYGINHREGMQKTNILLIIFVYTIYYNLLLYIKSDQIDAIISILAFFITHVFFLLLVLFKSYLKF